MFSLCIDLTMCPEIVAMDSDTVELERGFIRRLPIQHIRMQHLRQGDRLLVWIGEAKDPFDGAMVQSDAYAALQGIEGVRILLDWTRSPARVEIVRTADGSTPLHVTCEGGVLRATWDFEEIAFSLRRPAIDVEACKAYLEYGPALVRSQVIEGIYNVWPGEIVRGDAQGVSFTEQQSRNIATPSFLADRGMATEGFLEAIGASLATNIHRAKGVLIEVSGGLDSTCSALGAARLRDDLCSYGLIHDGPVGVQQRARRRELTELIALRDHERSSSAVSPIAALRHEECLFTPMDDNHRLTCVRAVESHPDSARLDLVVTGIGGDELGMERTYFRHDFEVAGLVASSAMLASVGRGDIFLRRGIWPANPLATHRVVDFCRRLPQQLREGRLLHLLTLARAGLSDGFMFPRYGENFGATLIREATLTDFDAEVGESILADHGINVFALLNEARMQVERDFTSELAVRLWRLVKLERILKKYVAGILPMKAAQADPH